MAMYLSDLLFLTYLYLLSVYYISKKFVLAGFIYARYSYVILKCIERIRDSIEDSKGLYTTLHPR